MTQTVWKFLAAAFVLGMTTAQAAVPYPSADTPKSTDRGSLQNLAGKNEISVTVVLRLRDPEGAENLLSALTTPGDPQFHKFLTPQQFKAQFGPVEADAAKVAANLKRYGLTVARASSLTLHATGTAANIDKAFGVTMHEFAVPAQGRTSAYSFRAPLTRPKVPDAVTGLVTAVVGFDTRPRFRPHAKQAPAVLRDAQQRGQNGSANIINSFGSLTVADFAQYYNVKPLYDAGITGSGRTLGIVSLANFTPSDAFAYWQRVGLTVDPGRITIVNIDGGPGAPSDVSGSIETTLDVEQSGGVAPGAKIRVYLAPNTGSQPYIDAFAQAIDDNIADTLSTSWGLWEGFESSDTATDPSTGDTVATTQAMHELFLQAGIQGQSLFAAAGDNGAYDVDGSVSIADGAVTVDYPASDPAITAAGGTTLPGKQQYVLTIRGEPKLFVINIPNERVWGEDYLKPLCKALREAPMSCDIFGGIFPVGGGGGVSVVFDIPTYQMTTKGKNAVPLAGIKTSAQGQRVLGQPLPAGFKGRNVPDISANADFNTGYSIDYTSDINGFGTATSFGGTSFVSPQLNGVTALLCQNASSRLGLLNTSLYNLIRNNAAKRRGGGPIRYITTGDNWFYNGANGYSPAAGAGVPDVAKLAAEPGF